MDDREKLNEGLRERGYRPHLPYPADAYIVELAGLPVEDIPRDGGIEPNGYWHFVVVTLDNGQKHKLTFNGVASRYYVPYTQEQKAIIESHWHLLSEECKHG
jgi:hypothetical protein